MVAPLVSSKYFGYSSVSKTAPVSWVSGSSSSAPVSWANGSSTSTNTSSSSGTVGYSSTNNSTSSTSSSTSSLSTTSSRGQSSGMSSRTNNNSNLTSSSVTGSTSSSLTSTISTSTNTSSISDIIGSSVGINSISGTSSSSSIGYSSAYQGSGWFGYSSINGSLTSSSTNFSGSSSISYPIGGHSSISTTSPVSQVNGSSSSTILSNSGNSVSNTTNSGLNNGRSSGIPIGLPPHNPPPTPQKVPSGMQIVASGQATSSSNVIESILQQYGYQLTSQELQEIDNLQSGQSVAIQGLTPVKVTYLGNDKYQIQTVGNPFTTTGQEVGLNLTVTIPTYSINQNGQISTGSILISGTVTNNVAVTSSNGIAEIFPYQTETYNVNETIPITSTINGNQITFQSGNPQGSVTLQSISLPTITTQQLQALESGQNTNIKPGTYYNPQTNQIINVSYQTVQQPQINWNQLWYGYSPAVSSQTVQNLPQNTYLFLNPIGYSSINPNVVYSIGVNTNTNTVYLINSYGQIIGTKTFNNIQSTLNYLQNNWNLNLNPTPQPGQPVLSTAINFNNLNPKLQLQSIILQNDQLVNNAITSLTNNPSTFLQDIATITTAGFSTTLADIGLKSQALSVQNFAQQMYYNSTLGNIVGGAEVGGIILLGFFAPETLLNFGIGAITGVGISEGISLATGQGPLSSSQIVAQAELGGLFSMVGGMAGGYLSAAFSKGAGALTTMITGSEEWGSKIAGLIPLWRFAGSEVTNIALSYPFFGNNPKEWLEWSTLFSLGDVFIPSISGSILSRLDVWRGKGTIAEEGLIKLPLEGEPIEGYIAKLPDNTVIDIIPRATAGEGTVPEFIETYVYEKGENNLLSHVTSSMTFINDLSKGKEVEIMPTSNPNAWDWRVAAGDTGLYLSPGESPNEAVALGFYGGIWDTHPSLEYPRFTRMSWGDVLYRFLHPFDKAGIILTNEDTAVGPLPPQELLDYIDYLKKKYNGNLNNVIDELLKNPKYGPMYMEWKNAVKEFSATTGIPVVGSEDITGLSHERQFVIEPGAKLKGTGVTYNVWIRQTPELLENLSGPLKDLLSDWLKVKVAYVDIIPGSPTDLFVIKNIDTQSSTISTNEKYKAKETTLETMNSIIEPSKSISDISEGESNIIKGSDLVKETETEETYYGSIGPLYNIYRIENGENIENTERMRYSGYSGENIYTENTREAETYKYNYNKYRENYNNEEYRITLGEYPYRENYYEYRINEYPSGFYYYRSGEYPPQQPPYIPYNPEGEQPNKNRNPPEVPPFEFPEITIMGQPIRGGFGLSRGIRTMYDIQYALSRLTL